MYKEVYSQSDNMHMFFIVYTVPYSPTLEVTKAEAQLCCNQCLPPLCCNQCCVTVLQSVFALLCCNQCCVTVLQPLLPPVLRHCVAIRLRHGVAIRLRHGVATSVASLCCVTVLRHCVASLCCVTAIEQRRVACNTCNPPLSLCNRLTHGRNYS